MSGEAGDACRALDELLEERNLERLDKVATMIYREFLSSERPQYSVVDKLASAVSPHVAEAGLFEALRVAEVRKEYRDVAEVVQRILAGLGRVECLEKALEACRRIAILALSKRFR